MDPRDGLEAQWIVRWGESGEECVVTSLVPLGTAVALYERGSNNGVSKELNLAPNGGKLRALRDR